LELEFLDLALERDGVGLDPLHRLELALEFREFEQLDRALNTVADAIETRRQCVELRAFLAERLSALRVVPDLGMLEFAGDLGEPFALAIVFKETPLRRRGVPRDP
jgi:hypothetical protein